MAQKTAKVDRMNTLVLRTDRQDVRFSMFSNGGSTPVLVRTIRAGFDSVDQMMALTSVRSDCELVAEGCLPDIIAIRVLFGGLGFREPVLVSASVLGELEELIPQSPLHLPGTVELIEGCSRVFSGVPIVLVFETAFFVDMPAREHLYGVDVNSACNAGLRRYGYRGIHHEAGCKEVHRKERQNGRTRAQRILSIVLGRQIEVAAVFGRRPVMVTSGATPLEGIIGETSSGAIDPSIVLTLAEKTGWGPERINTVLTKESGLSALADRPVSLAEVFELDSDDLKAVREIVEYKILNACGAGVAALGGLDAIVFSGEYVSIADVVGQRLIAELRKGLVLDDEVCLMSVTETLDYLIARKASVLMPALQG